GGARLLRRGQRPQGQVVGAVEHAGSGDLGAQVAGAEAVRRLPVGVGIDVVAGADGRVVRQPGIAEGVEPLHGDQAGRGAGELDVVRRAGRVRGGVLERAVVRPAVHRI